LICLVECSFFYSGLNSATTETSCDTTNETASERTDRATYSAYLCTE
jgi:hypothetical protein